MTDLIPKKIHVVWLGRVFMDGRENIEHWMRKNPDYEINLWVDSLLYADEAEHECFVECKRWADVHGIQVRDLNENARYIREEMLSESFYNDEILGKDCNFAAASELTRVEALYREGGVYFDALDVFPGEEAIGELQAQYRFLCRGKDGMDFDVDVLASVPYGEIITCYRENIFHNYRSLYANTRLLEAHRNSSYRGPDVFFGGDSRRISLAQISSTEVMCKTIENLGLDFSDVEVCDALSFPYNTYVRPEESQASWLDVRKWSEGRSADWSKAQEILRHYVILSLREQIREYLQVSYPEGENPSSFLSQIKKQIQAFPLHTSLQNLYHECCALEREIILRDERCPDRKERIFTEEIISKIGKSAVFLEDYFFPNLEANYSAQDVERALHSRYSIVNTCLAEKLSVFFNFMFLRRYLKADFLKLFNLEPKTENADEHMSYVLVREYFRIENRLDMVREEWKEDLLARRGLLQVRMQKDMRYLKRQLHPQFYHDCCENVALDIKFARQVKAFYDASDESQRKALIPTIFLIFNLVEFWTHKFIILTSYHHKYTIDIELARGEFYQWFFKEIHIQEEMFFDEMLKPFQNLFPIRSSAAIFSGTLDFNFHELKNWFENNQDRVKSLLRVALSTNENLIVPCLRYLDQSGNIDEETRNVLLLELWSLINKKHEYECCIHIPEKDYADSLVLLSKLNPPGFEDFIYKQYLTVKGLKFIQLCQFIAESRERFVRSMEEVPPIFTIYLSSSLLTLYEEGAFKRIENLNLFPGLKTLHISFDIDTSYSSGDTLNRVFIALDRMYTLLYQLKKQNKLEIEQLVYTGAHRREDLGLETELGLMFMPEVLVNAAYHFSHPEMFGFFRKFFWEDVDEDRVIYPVGNQIKLICQFIHIALNLQDLTSEQLANYPKLLLLAHTVTELRKTPRIAQQLEKGNVYDFFFELTKQLKLNVYPKRGFLFITHIEDLTIFLSELINEISDSDELQHKLVKPVFDTFSDQRSSVFYTFSPSNKR